MADYETDQSGIYDGQIPIDDSTAKLTQDNANADLLAAS